MEKRSTFSMMLYAKKTVENKMGESPLYLRITMNGESASLSLYKTVVLKYWNTKLGMVQGSDKYSKEMNHFLMAAQAAVYEHYKAFRDRGLPFSVTDVRDAYIGKAKSAKGKKLLDVYREHNEKIRTLIGIDYTDSTVERYDVSLNHTRNFIAARYQRDDMFLNELNYEFITDFEIFLKTKKGIAHNTTMKYVKNLKKVIRIAIANGDLSKDPFSEFKVRMKKVDRGYLTEDELKILINKKFSNARLDQVRDCFVFSCFTGLAHADLIRVSQQNIINGSDGKKWIKIHRQKTDNLSSIPLLAAAKAILEKYKDHPQCVLNNVILPVNSNQKMNAYLKEIADLCGISKNLSCHLARHTFATTVTLNNDVPIETVSKMLGHTSLNVTRIYARLLDKKIGQDMKHLDGMYQVEG